MNTQHRELLSTRRSFLQRAALPIETLAMGRKNCDPCVEFFKVPKDL